MVWQIEQLASMLESERGDLESERRLLRAADCETTQLRSLNAELAARLVCARANASLLSSSTAADAETPQSLYESTSVEAPSASSRAQCELLRLENEYLRAALRGRHLPPPDMTPSRAVSDSSNK